MIKKPIKRLAVIHDLSGFGKAALTNIIPVLSIMGIEVCPVPTMILSTHTGGFGKPHIIRCNNYVENAFNHYNEQNIEFDGVFIGYLGTIDNIINCIEKYKLYERFMVFDPICGDNGKLYSNFNMEYIKYLKKLISYSYVITPNYTEACLIGGYEIKNNVSKNEIEVICKNIVKLTGVKNIIVTSVPIDNSKIGTFVYEVKNSTMIVNEKLPKSYPGTGDIFTAMVSGSLMEGKTLVESAMKACEFISYCIKVSSSYDYPTKEGILLEPCLKKLLNP